MSGRSLAVIAVFCVGSVLAAGSPGGGSTADMAAQAALRPICGDGRLPVDCDRRLTAFLFFLQLRGYYASSHTHELSYRMLWEQVFTGATTAYIFVVMGVRVLLPVMLLPLLPRHGISPALSRAAASDMAPPPFPR
ncbi:MAG: hypothetical protein HPM95_11395 [Alphaproteobacteria bacterium]|nr:hypothetical protein [Alphaproteobacteria bacterium]